MNDTGTCTHSHRERERTLALHLAPTSHPWLSSDDARYTVVAALDVGVPSGPGLAIGRTADVGAEDSTVHCALREGAGGECLAGGRGVRVRVRSALCFCRRGAGVSLSRAGPCMYVCMYTVGR